MMMEVGDVLDHVAVLDMMWMLVNLVGMLVVVVVAVFRF